MSIEVNGNNNRVAGRDYYEVPIKPCPSCAQRIIERNEAKCRPCIAQERAEAVKGQLMLFGLAVMFCFGWLLQRREDQGTPVTTMESFVETGLQAGLLVFGAFLLLQCALYWVRTRNW